MYTHIHTQIFIISKCPMILTAIFTAILVAELLMISPNTLVADIAKVTYVFLTRFYGFHLIIYLFFVYHMWKIGCHVYIAFGDGLWQVYPLKLPARTPSNPPNLLRAPRWTRSRARCRWFWVSQFHQYGWKSQYDWRIIHQYPYLMVTGYMMIIHVKSIWTP